MSTRIKDPEGTIIYPATEGSLQDLIATFIAGDAGDATEATLADLRNNVGLDVADPAIYTVLGRLKALNDFDFATETTQQTLATELTADAIRDNIGEIGTDPVENTVQDRLKTIATLLSSLATYQAIPTTPDHYTIAQSLTPVTILAANTDRIGVSIHNHSTGIMYVKLGTGVTDTSFTVGLEEEFFYEIPFRYTGAVTAVWSKSGSGSAQVTEYVI